MSKHESTGPVLANPIALRVLEAFGLPSRNAVAVSLELRSNQLAKVTVEYLPSGQALEQVSQILREFQLVPARPATEPAVGPVSAVDRTPPPLDAWGPPR